MVTQTLVCAADCGSQFNPKETKMTKVFLMRVPQLSKNEVKALHKVKLPSHVDRSKVDLKVFSTPKHESEGGYHFKVYQQGGAIADIWASSENNLIHYLKERHINYSHYIRLC